MRHRFFKCGWLACVVLLGCGNEAPDTNDARVFEAVTEVGVEDSGAACFGTPCSSVAECGELGPCVSNISCDSGCCVRTFSPQGQS